MGMHRGKVILRGLYDALGLYIPLTPFIAIPSTQFTAIPHRYACPNRLRDITGTTTERTIYASRWSGPNEIEASSLIKASQ